MKTSYAIVLTPFSVAPIVLAPSDHVVKWPIYIPELIIVKAVKPVRGEIHRYSISDKAYTPAPTVKTQPRAQIRAMMEAMKKPTPVTISDELLAKIDTVPDQPERFDAALRKVLAYPRAAMLQHEAEHRKEVAANPKRRGPKPKSAGPGPGVELSA